MGTAIKESSTEDRDLYVIFMSDGAAMQWNYYHSQGASSLWNNWITGAWTANQLSLNCNTHAYYYDEGVQLFPIIAYDENIKTVEVTCFGQKQTKEVHTGKLLLFTFDAINAETNEINATAYDENGNSIYYYNNTQEFPLWISSQSLF